MPKGGYESSSGVNDGLQWGVLVAIFAGGLRHGFDLDHVAAIADMASSQSTRTRSFLLASAYASGTRASSSS